MGRKRQNTAPSPVPAAAYRDRIVGHKKVPAAALKPNVLNYRTHPEEQAQALQGSFTSLGVARSVLAHVSDADRREALGDDASDNPRVATLDALERGAALTLIDGHLRVEQLKAQNLPVEVEILDVNDEEARLLLATLDPLAALAGHDAGKLDELLAELGPQQEALQRVIDELAASARQAEEETPPEEAPPAEPEAETFSSGWFVLVECDSEEQQRELIDRFIQEGLSCKAMCR